MSPFLFKSALLLHILGFATLAGLMLADFVTFHQFWKLINQDRQKAQWLRKLVAYFPILIANAGLLVIVSGILLVMATRADMLFWFRLKMILVILFVLNMIFMGPKQAKKMDKLLISEQALKVNDEIVRVKKRLQFFYISQLLIMLAIFVLCSFRF